MKNHLKCVVAIGIVFVLASPPLMRSGGVEAMSGCGTFHCYSYLGQWAHSGVFYEDPSYDHSHPESRDNWHEGANVGEATSTNCISGSHAECFPE